MMKIYSVLILLLLWTIPTLASAKIPTGESVPDLSLTDSNGQNYNLADFAGKTVVLEWTNHDCPYVKKHYNSKYKNMQILQAEAAEEDIVWLSVISSAPGKQGHVTGAQANELTRKRAAVPAAVILDPQGMMGRRFSARTTPHMFIIDAHQTLVYQGAIDDRRNIRPASIAKATNYVRQALSELKSGQPVSVNETAPYGCSVKYGR